MRATHIASSLVALLMVSAFAQKAHAAWQGDFESGDLSQWSYLLNEEGLKTATTPVLLGKYSGEVRIDGTNLWSNGLNRVELQHMPDDASAEGAHVFFGWSVYLPAALTTDDHQIGYWESDQSYQQVMSLHAKGQDLSFNTNLPAYKQHWTGAGKLTPGVWHRIVYGVTWSTDANAGEVNLWFDGEQVVTAAHARTYVDNPAFTQIGILRDTIDSVETMYIDEAREGQTYDEVALLDTLPKVAPTPTPSASAPAPAATDPAATDPAGTPSSAIVAPLPAPNPMPAPSATNPGSPAPPTPSSAPPQKSKDDSSCSLVNRPSSPWAALGLLVASGALFGTRRRALRR
ncbi:MAG TPA: heparin lyase I family protein [Polyangiaceae bacterium]|jgi:hypothetical protein|nr:heparin lyase I family protein [Polyangiaceae bacterium]